MTTSERRRIVGLGELAQSRTDLLIIGGGIVGAGIARDAASRGLRILLVEQGDFASGTSSRSSRLLHGGLRYLAQGNLRLVREASREKMLLHGLAPHLSAPLPFLFPVWKGQGWSRWQLSWGVRLYDLLCGGRNLGPSSTMSKSALLQRLPLLRTAGLTGGTRHFDGLTQDARLVIDTLRTAESDGGTVRNYTSFVRGDRHNNGWLCEIRDELTSEVVSITPSAVVNAAGAWGEKFPQSRIPLRLTKGVHLVVRRSRFAVDEAVVLPEGKRILFVIPWGDRTILGTTDTDFQGDLEKVRAETEDVNYILEVVNRAFPLLELTSEDVVSSWAGVRPLIASQHDSHGSPSDTSRDHLIRHEGNGWFDVAGGKLTTYRLMAEQVVNRIGEFLAIRLPRSQTAKRPLVAGRFSGVLPPEVNRTVVEEACQKEWAYHLDDIMLRRTSWHYYRDDVTEVAQRTADWMGAFYDWTTAERAVELERYGQICHTPHAVETHR